MHVCSLCTNSALDCCDINICRRYLAASRQWAPFNKSPTCIKWMFMWYTHRMPIYNTVTYVFVYVETYDRSFCAQRNLFLTPSSEIFFFLLTNMFLLSFLPFTLRLSLLATANSRPEKVTMSAHLFQQYK